MKDNTSLWHGIVIEEAIRDKSIFDSMRVLGRKPGTTWNILKVGIIPEKIEEIVSLVKANLITEKGIPYYAHFYKGEDLIVVFPEEVFRASPDRISWGDAITYGMSVGVPVDELDFKPARLEEETW